jgi:hypothetical protein
MKSYVTLSMCKCGECGGKPNLYLSKSHTNDFSLVIACVKCDNIHVMSMNGHIYIDTLMALVNRHIKEWNDMNEGEE